MPVDPLLSLLVGAFGAALLGLVGAWIQSRREHEKWLRERRYEAYRAFMLDMDTLGDLATTTPTVANAVSMLKRLTALQRGYADAYEAVSLLGPKRVNQAGQHWVWAARDLSHDKSGPGQKAWNDARWKFLIAAGKEIKSKNVGKVPPTRPTVDSAPPASS